MNAPPAYEVQKLGKDLLADPASNLNNVVHLLKALHAKQAEVRKQRKPRLHLLAIFLFVWCHNLDPCSLAYSDKTSLD
jgi:hypothetical protein